MKKKFAHLGRILTREEAKMIVGGTAPVDDVDDGGGSCQAQGEAGHVWTGLDMETARYEAQSAGGHWCCAQCCTATWANHSNC
ncbi:MAG: hypothetical protein JST29_06505 [Bacteroidetes bacterium]|nr:hypothetical protein [Bacteroidota bacterium]MBS1591045.1 hypothetical protein [Bacteroidota bacterium]